MAVILSKVRAMGGSASSLRPSPWRSSAVFTDFRAISDPLFDILRILASPPIQDFFQMLNRPYFGRDMAHFAD
jgi:hypothetical protein